MKVQPIGERVLIKPKKEAERTKGGIYIPDAAKESKKEQENKLSDLMGKL